MNAVGRAMRGRCGVIGALAALLTFGCAETGGAGSEGTNDTTESGAETAGDEAGSEQAGDEVSPDGAGLEGDDGGLEGEGSGGPDADAADHTDADVGGQGGGDTDSSGQEGDEASDDSEGAEVSEGAEDSEGEGADADEGGWTGPPPQLIITEIMYDPNAVTDALGEWFEIYNAESSAVDLRGLTIGDDDTSHTIQATEPVWVPAGGYVVLAREGNPAVNGGVQAVYVYGNIPLGNVADSVFIKAGATLVDRVAWDENQGWPNAVGSSLQLSISSLDAGDNDEAGAWCLSTEAWAGGDLGSPGEANLDCIDDGTDSGTGGDTTDTSDTSATLWGLVITEIMYDPAAVADTAGEWFEVYNTGDETAILNGLQIGKGSGTPHTVTSPNTLTLAPGAYAVFARNGDPGLNGGVVPLYVWSGFQLTNTADSLVLSSKGEQIHRVDYDETNGWPNAVGASIQLDPAALLEVNNHELSYWCLSTSAFGAGDLGTPGAVNKSCGGGTADPDPTDAGESDAGESDVGEADTAEPDTGPLPPDYSALVITEIMYDPTVVADNVGEWVEIYNTGTETLDLGALHLADNAGASKLAPVSGASTAPIGPGAYAVVGRSGNVAVNGGVPVVATFTVSLNNGVDSVILVHQGTEIDRVDYDVSKGWPGAPGTAMQLDGAIEPGSVASNNPSNWCAATTTYAGGADKGTPGAPNLPCNPTSQGASCATAGCGGSTASGCWCDADCLANQDCCADACASCGQCGPTCQGKCGSTQVQPTGCYCDSGCAGFGDCCPDACATCGFCP